MILYYAMGGGLGHLVRASAFLHTFDIREFKIFTSSAYADRVFTKKDQIRIDPDLENYPEKFLATLRFNLRKYRIECIILDCFSSGILGEIGKMEDVFHTPLWYVTRRMRWNRYREKASTDLKYEKCFVLEEPEQDHLAFINRYSQEVKECTLKYPPEKPSNRMPELENKKTWIVVHSGPVEEIKLLVEHANDIASAENVKPDIYVVSMLKTGVYKTIDYYPASALFPGVERIFTGCGFNIMQQTHEYREKHVFIPFERRYDDQFWRAGKAKKNRSG